METLKTNSILTLRETFLKWYTPLNDHKLYSLANEKGVFSFVRNMEFFVGTFKDILIILAEKFTGQGFLGDELANHSKEDGAHWVWFEKDLTILKNSGAVPSGMWSYRERWGPKAQDSRFICYKLLSLALEAKNPVEAIFIVEGLEYTSRIFIKNYHSRLASHPLYSQLSYYGKLHLQEESDHDHEMLALLPEEEFISRFNTYIDAYHLNESKIASITAKLDQTLALFVTLKTSWTV